jgi:hypothetical protein
VCLCVCVCLCAAWGDREADTERGNKDANNGSSGSNVRNGAFINAVPAGII